MGLADPTGPLVPLPPLGRRIMQGNKVLIVGAGATGGYFGALLFRAGVDVTFLVRPQTYTQISEKGLSIKSASGDFVVHPPLIKDSSEISEVDLIILAVKCYDIPAVLEQVAQWVEAGATLMTLQNGIDSEDRILSAFGHKDCLVAGVAYITARLAEPGVIEHYRRGTLSLGELSGETSPRASQIHALLSRGGFPCRLTDQIQVEKWEKLCWNATFNPLSVILDHPISLVLQSESLLEIVRQAIREIIAVAAAEGISIHSNIIENTLSVSHPLGEYYTSMYEDYKNGKPTEIEQLNGEIIRRGGKFGIPVPNNRILYALVKGLELKRDRLK